MLRQVNNGLKSIRMFTFVGRWSCESINFMLPRILSFDRSICCWSSVGCAIRNIVRKVRLRFKLEKHDLIVVEASLLVKIIVLNWLQFFLFSIFVVWFFVGILWRNLAAKIFIIKLALEQVSMRVLRLIDFYKIWTIIVAISPFVRMPVTRAVIDFSWLDFIVVDSEAFVSMS